MASTKTKTTRNDSEDVAMADTMEPNESPPSSRSNSSLPLTCLKFAFKMQKTEKSDIAKIYHDLLVNIEELDPTATFHDSVVLLYLRMVSLKAPLVALKLHLNYLLEAKTLNRLLGIYILTLFYILRCLYSKPYCLRATRVVNDFV